LTPISFDEKYELKLLIAETKNAFQIWKAFFVSAVCEIDF